MDIKVDEHTVVVFDLDDTLYNELDYLKSAYKSIAEFLLPDNWQSLYSKMLSMYRSRLNVFEFLISSFEVSKESLLNLYRNHNPDIQLFEDVIEVFNAIKSKGGYIGIITDGRSATQRAKIKSLGIEHYVDALIISEELGSEKPNIQNFKAIETSLKGKCYYYIGDNFKKDFIAPNGLGWTSIGLIDNGKNIHFESYKEENPQNLPDYLIIGFDELRIV